MGINAAWACEQLELFVKMTTPAYSQGPVDAYDEVWEPAASHDQIVAAAEVIEQVLDRVFPHWRVEARFYSEGSWQRHRAAAQRAHARLARAEEVRAGLGEDSPTLDASRLHPWVWDGARSLWNSGHFAEAVAAAGRKVNAETQNKIGRRDLAEANLFKQILSIDAPAPSKARLRLHADDGSDTYKSVHRGAMALAEGLYAAVRNPIAHEADSDLSEQDALEQLAAFSVLARWIERAAVLQADP